MTDGYEIRYVPTTEKWNIYQYIKGIEIFIAGRFNSCEAAAEYISFL